MVKNKKGWLRIVEAIFGILILSSVLLVMYNNNVKVANTNSNISEVQRNLLREFVEDYKYRRHVLEEKNTSILDFFGNRIGSQFSFSVVICNLSEQNCESSVVGSLSGVDVYSEETIFSGLPNEYEPRRIKLFVWMKEGFEVRNSSIDFFN